MIKNNLEDLDIITARIIEGQREKIEFLFSKFKKRAEPRYAVNKHVISFGMFLAEYIINMKTISIEASVDNILLYGRRLCEIFIVSKYMNKNNNFHEFVDYCVRDRYDYLEGFKKRAIADVKIFPELEGLDYYLNDIEAQQVEVTKKHGNKGKKMPNISDMAKDIGYEEEYIYFYKFASKLLHFCPFSLNGDMPLEDKIHKRVFISRIGRYLTDIKKELDSIYEKTKLKNL